MPDDFDRLVAGLRAWTRDHDPHVRAAVELLIWHEHWLRRADFRLAATRVVGRGGRTGDAQRYCLIDWDAAREYFGQGPRGSTSEMAVLDLAIALGKDRFRLNIMGEAHSRAVATAFAAAVGLEPADLEGAVRAERRRIRGIASAMAVTLRRPDGTKVDAIPVADLNEVIGSDG